MDAVSQPDSTQEQTQTSFCTVPCAGMIYAAPHTRAEFDAIALPATVHEWKADAARTLIKNDGRQWESRCTSKFLESKGGVLVFLQWFDHRPVEAGGAA